MMGTWHRLTCAATVLALLACGGVIPGAAEESAEASVEVPVAPAPPSDPVPVPVEEPPPAPVPAPTALFDSLDADEEPPRREPRCAKGTMLIRNPSQGGLRLYCANYAGKKQGPWIRRVGRTVVETRTYDEGVQNGRSTTWSRKGGALRKRSETNFVDGEETGEYAEWNQDGVLVVRGAKKAGAREGRFIWKADDPTVFKGACFVADEPTWTTADPVAFVKDPCP